MKKKVTIHDLARILKKDSSTISRALADSPRVKQKTRDLIQAKAKELGYYRNLQASSLRNQKTQTIGVIVPHISKFFFSTVIAGIEELAFERGYRVIICQSMDNFKREKQLVHTLLSSQVDGIIMSISMETNHYDHLLAVKKQDVPVVFFDRKCEALPATNILIDDYSRAFEATEHLIKSGKKSIAHFTGPKNVSIYESRLNGYLDALEKHNLVKDDTLIFSSRLKPEDGESMAIEIMKQENKPDAILSANDMAAISAMRVFQQNGVQIPKELAIIGFSNEPLGAYTNPSLSSINQNPNEMGQLAIETLLQQIEVASSQFEIKLVDSSLVLRDSSK
ncbi:MAG: LacI family DNA-binding transcriptional regulator [Reichenbachiella sp.]